MEQVPPSSGGREMEPNEMTGENPIVENELTLEQRTELEMALVEALSDNEEI